MDDPVITTVYLVFSASNNIAEDYVFYKKERQKLLHDVILPFLLLPREQWTRPPLEEYITELVIENGGNPDRIRDYQADIGPYRFCVRSDHSHLEECAIYRAEIYHREIPENKEQGLAFKCTPEEAMMLYFNVDHIVRDVQGQFEFEIREIVHDLNALLEIKRRLRKS
ncbi:MAG: hypothetical protein Q8R37_05375 [Nanoarchaeota archaeon]|nr:hypothetical protein [Nanoarchaeota archaeon]